MAKRNKEEREERKKRRQARKAKKQESPKNNVDPKTGLTIPSTSDIPEDQKTTSQKKMEAYNKRQAENKEKNKITSTTKKSGAYGDAQDETLSKGGKDITDSEPSAQQKKVLQQIKNDQERVKREEKQAELDAQEDVPAPPGISEKENRKLLRKQKKALIKGQRDKIKKQKEAEEGKIQLDSDKSKIQKIIEKRTTGETIEVKNKDGKSTKIVVPPSKIRSKILSRKTENIYNRGNMSDEVKKDLDEKADINDATRSGLKARKLQEKAEKKSEKGKQVNKILQRRIAKNLQGVGISEDKIAEEMRKYESLNAKNKNDMFKMGSQMGSRILSQYGGGGGGSTPVNTEGMTSADKRRVATAQMANDLEYFKMRNPVLSPTDYYPQAGRSIAVGTSTGEIIGSRTIYTGAGVLAPMGLYDARKRALAAATKAGIANSQGDIPKLPEVADKYIADYEEYSSGVMNEIMSNKEYIKNGSLTSEGKAKMMEAIETGNNINKSIAWAKEYNQHLTGEAGGEGKISTIDDVYYSGEAAKLMRDLLSGDVDLEDFKNKELLQRIARGEGGKYRNAEKDFTAQIMDNLLKETARDKENLMNDKYQTAEGSNINPSEFIDKSNGLLTQAYMTKVGKIRVDAAVDAFYDANPGVYSDEQKKGIKDLAMSQIGKQETITTKNQPSASTSRGARAKLFNRYFSGMTTTLYNKTVPALEDIGTGATDDEIRAAYMTTAGGTMTTTGMFGADAPTVKNDLVSEAKVAIGVGGATNRFAMFITRGDGTTSQENLTAQEIVNLVDNGVLPDGTTDPSAGLTAWGSGQPINDATWFQGYMDLPKYTQGKAYATPVADVNSMGWVNGGVATPLNASNYDAWVESDSKIQLKGMYYKPFLDDLVIGEIEDADANFKQFVKEIDSSPEVYLVGRTQVVPNTPNNAVNIGNSNLLASDKSDENQIK